MRFIAKLIAKLRPQHWDLFTGEPTGYYKGLYYVRSFFEHEDVIYQDEGPLDELLANIVLADIGVDATVPYKDHRVPVLRATLIREDEFRGQPFTKRQSQNLNFLKWLYAQPTFAS